jgi:hypothetical protein
MFVDPVARGIFKGFNNNSPGCNPEIPPFFSSLNIFIPLMLIGLNGSSNE